MTPAQSARSPVKIAAELTARRVQAARGGAWSPMQVSRLLALID